MFRIWNLLLVICAVSSATDLRADDELAFEVRGPGPRVGQTIRTKSSFKMPEGEVSLKSDGVALPAVSMTMITESEEEYTVQAVEGRSVTKFTTRIVKDVTFTKNGSDGEDTQSTGDLKGQLVVSELDKSGWKHSLSAGMPTAEQKTALARLSGWDDEAEIPAGKQKLGTSWKIDLANIKKQIGLTWAGVNGHAKATLIGLKLVDGEACAMIETVGNVKGKFDVGGTAMLASLDIKVTDYRSLKTGVSRRTEGDIDMTITGKITAGGKTFDTLMHGKATLESTSAVND